MKAPAPRYLVCCVASGDYDEAHWQEPLLVSSRLATAKRYARRYSYRCMHGTAVLDTLTNKLDVGFGFGVPPPVLDDA